MQADSVMLRVMRSSPLGGYPYDTRDLRNSIWNLIETGKTVLGEKVEQFEQDFAAYVGTRFCRGVNSGLDALILSLRALEIGAGDEVITQANTFHATALAICAVGATPVLVDVDPATFQIDPAQLEQALSPATKAILPVHLYGQAAPMDEVMQLARSASLFVVEDAAQSHGATIRGRRVGSFGDMACFSFHPSKNLAAAGDAGAVCMGTASLDERVRALRWMGQQQQNVHQYLGMNSKLDALQALILSAKLPFLDAANQRRRETASIYRQRLRDLPVTFQQTLPEHESVYHLFQVRTERRDALLAHLIAHGVEAVVRYPTPIHLQPAFARFGWDTGDFPVAERLATELLCLPLRPDMTEEEIEWVITCVRTFFD